MKKILLLFVLGFGLSSAVYASSEIQSVIEITPILSSTSDSPESPDWIYIKWADGTREMIRDGDDCLHVYEENGNGLLDFDHTDC